MSDMPLSSHQIGWSEFLNSCLSSADFYTKVAGVFIDNSVALTRILFDKDNWRNAQGLEKMCLSKSHDIFDSRFRQEAFVNSLSKAIDCYSKLAQTTGMGQWYQIVSNLSSLWNNYFIEPLRDTVWRTPSHQLHSEGKFSLYHYHQTINSGTKGKTPVLIIYAFINRHYILDLLPQVSIIRNLLEQGLDIFSTDWGTPSAYDQHLTLAHYVNNYLDNSVDHIREHTNSDKVSLFGYCWDGDLALMYAALHPEKVKNVITLATPGDFDLDDGLLTLWTKKINVDSMVEAFGNVPSMMLNAAFALRSPIDFLHKYAHFFEKPRDIESFMEFFATEMWLYDSPPVIGEIYRQFVKDCYQQNLLIKNEMKIGEGMVVDLKNISMPYLNILATKDDLVAPNSSKALNDVVGSDDKSLLEFDSGHVGACIGSKAHKELWSKVGHWLISRS
jgi:polyhydroxyalkanoate synthase